MNCPNCTHELHPQHIGSVAYFRCTKCNSLWFDNKESDFLTLDEVTALNDEFPGHTFEKKAYTCPRCHKAMTREDYGYHCYFCGGVLTSAQSLLKEKAKKTKQMEKRFAGMPSLRNVVIVSAVFLLVGLNYTIITNLINKKTNLQTQAAEINKFVKVQKVGKQAAVFFTTNELSRSEIVVKDMDRSGQPTVKTLEISTEPSLTHFVLVPLPTKNTKLIVRFISPESGKITESKEISPLELMKE